VSTQTCFVAFGEHDVCIVYKDAPERTNMGHRLRAWRLAKRANQRRAKLAVLQEVEHFTWLDGENPDHRRMAG
jgi:hypothetical protein